MEITNRLKAPNIESILALNLKKKNHMEKTRTYEGNQSTVPVDNNLVEKLGVRKGDKIYFFAGGGGNWAEKIGEKTKLTFADLTKRIVDKIGRRRKIGEKQVVINALRVPVIENEFDWSMSFEPVPLAGEALPITVLRGLLNKGGVKIIRHSMYSGEDKIAEVLSKIYGVKSDKKFVGIKCYEKPGWRNFFTGRESKRHVITTVYSNEAVKHKVLRDLSVMMLIEKVKSRGEKNVPLKKLFEKAAGRGFKKEDIAESLERINKFSELLPKEHQTILEY